MATGPIKNRMEYDLRLALGMAIVRSGYYDQDDETGTIDVLKTVACDECPRPQDRKCGCSGMPYLSDEIWAAVDLTEFLSDMAAIEQGILEANRTISELQARVDYLEREQWTV